MRSKKIFFCIFILLLFTIHTLGNSKYKMSMTSQQGLCGCVIAAPHGGYELCTEEIVALIADKLNWGYVIAIDYRKPDIGRWINVNRPTEHSFMDGKPTKRQHSHRAQKTFDKYIENIACATKHDEVSIFVEIHGHSRVQQSSDLLIDVIEITSTGFSFEELTAITENYQKKLDIIQPQIRLPLLMDHLNSEEESIDLKYKASQAKKIGVFKENFISKSLHIELPYNLRTNEKIKQEYTIILTLLLKDLCNKTCTN